MDTEFLSLQPVERKGDRTRSRLLAAAIAEFNEHGVEQANIADITKRAGVSRSAFYAYFPSRDDVLLQLTRQLEAGVANKVAAAADLRAALDIYIDQTLAGMKALGSPRVFASMLHRFISVPISQNADYDMVRALQRHFVFAAGKDHLAGDIEPERAAILLMTSVFGYLISACEVTAEEQLREDLRTITGLYLKPR